MTRPAHLATFWLSVATLFIVALPSLANAQSRYDAPSSPRDNPPSRATFGPGTVEGPMAIPKKRPDGRATLELRDGSRVIGKLKNLTQLKCQTQFGEVTIPFEKIAGLRFADPGNPNVNHAGGVTIEFKNGDSVIGKVELESIEFESQWGGASVATDKIWSIINSPVATAWHWNGRWRLARPDAGCQPNTFDRTPARSYEPHSGFSDSPTTPLRIHGATVVPYPSVPAASDARPPARGSSYQPGTTIRR